MSFSKTILSSFFYFVIFVQVLSALTSSVIKINEYVGDQGRNLTIPCNTKNKSTVVWIKDDLSNEEIKNVLENGSLVLNDLSVNDSGIYTCFIIFPNGGDPLKYNSSDYSMVNSSSYDEEHEKSKNFINNARTNDKDDRVSLEYYKARVRIRTPPGAVAYFRARVTTIVGVIMWKVFDNRTGGHPLKYFTADFRKSPEYFPSDKPPEWKRLDPNHITPNARQLEVFGLKPNTTYEFRIYASNILGPGEIVTTNATTVSQWEEVDLVRLIEVDAKNFDTRVWIIAVSIVLGTLLILSVGTSILLCKECRESSEYADDDMDSMELVPNIILNPGFCDEEDDQRPPSPIFTKTFGKYDRCADADSEEEEPWTFKQDEEKL